MIRLLLDVAVDVVRAISWGVAVYVLASWALLLGLGIGDALVP